MAGSTSYKKSSRFVIDRKMLTAGVMAFFVALAVVNNMALNVSVALQPELIGGIRVVVGDEVLDTSVKARLDQMKVALSA